MENSNKIKSVLKSMVSSPLFVDKQSAMQLLLRYNSVVNSGVLENEELSKLHLEQMNKETSVSYYNANNVYEGSNASDFENLPVGSIALVPVMGAMSRESYCTMATGYVSGTRDLEKTIERLEANDSVSSIIFYINTPGGSANGNESLANKIQACKKPTLGLFEMMASAGVAAFQGVDELYAVESTSQWGSIGTYVSMYDDSKMWESMGIDIIEIYAPQSSEKNKAYREAVGGNIEPMEKELEKMTSAFIGRVKKMRPSIKDDGLVYKGKIYNATEAKKIGAIDGIKDLNYVLKRAKTLSKNGKKQIKSTAEKNQIEKMDDTTKKQVGWFNKLFPSLSVDQADQEMVDLSKSMESLQESNAAFVAASKVDKAQLETLNKSNASLTEQLEAAKAENTKIKEEKEAYEKQISTQLAGAENIEGGSFDSVEQLVEDHKKVIAHNKELGAAKEAGTPVNNQQDTSHIIDNNLKQPKSYNEIKKAAEEQIEAAKNK